MKFKDDFIENARGNYKDYWNPQDVEVFSTRVRKATKDIVRDFKKYATRIETTEKITNYGLLLVIKNLLESRKVPQNFKEHVDKELQKARDEIFID